MSNSDAFYTSLDLWIFADTAEKKIWSNYGFSDLASFIDFCMLKTYRIRFDRLARSDYRAIPWRNLYRDFIRFYI